MPHSRLRSRRWLIACSAVMLGLTGCGRGDGTQGALPESDGTGDITVFAAASLTEAFTEIGKNFESTHPGMTVRFNFAGSSTLAQQIVRGAPAGVFASANPAQMRKVVDAGRVVDGPTVFVRNSLQIVVPAGNPANVTGLADFGKEDLAIAICAEQVPCGAASREAFEAAGVTPAADTLEQDVKGVLTKVALGEADAGLVYRTDVSSAGGDVAGIDFREADQAVNDYPIAALTDAPNPAAALIFLDYVRSSHGRRVLAESGFVTVAP